MQWHPIFARLLRPLLQDYYEVRTDLPVGDLPRQADIVLLRRTAPDPFVGLWSHLRTWNILEFKGPTDDPGMRDLDLLFEVGLGIDRRLNEDRQQQRQAALGRDEVSWWYLANHVGRRFRAEAEAVLGQSLEPVGEGLWRGVALGRTLWLVSRDGLPVDRESVPLHLVTQEPPERAYEVAREVARQPGFWELYGSWLFLLYSREVWEEVQRMVRTLGTEPNLDLRPLIDLVGLKQVIDQVGLKQVIDQVGVQRLVDEAGGAEVIAALGIEGLLAHLTPEQRQELKRRLS